MEIFTESSQFPGYSVSNTGRVISYKQKTPRELHIHHYSNGYCFVSLNGKSVLLHRLVLMTFNPVEGMENL